MAAPKKAPGAAPAPDLPALHPDHLKAIVEGRHPRPHEALGQHPATVGGVDGFVIRAVRPLAATVTAVQKDGTRIPLEHVASGLWHGFAPGAGQAYTLEASYDDAPSWTADDPYRFVPTVGEVDLYLWGEGRHEQLWDVLGSPFRPH